MMIAAKIDGTTPEAAASQQHAKLVDAAQQFEAIFMGELLKPMQSKEGSWGDDDSSGDSDGQGGGDGGSGGTLASYGVESMARAIAKAGGMGIARQIVEKVSREAEKTSAGRSGTKV